MRSTFVFAGAIAILGAVILTGTLVQKADASTGPIPLNCNRACLENVVDQYLAALVAHDPKRLPLSKDVKYTENDQVIELGDGFWKTVEGRGNYTHIFADPEFGQVAFMGTMREAGAPFWPLTANAHSWQPPKPPSMCWRRPPLECLVPTWLM